MKNSIISIIKNKMHFSALNGVPESEIEQAQAILNCRFSREYEEYLREFGIASYQGHELTGLCGFERLNVINVTLYEREKNRKVPQSYYVVERTNMDGEIIWQDSTGVIYSSYPDEEPVRLHNSLEGYIDS